MSFFSSESQANMIDDTAFEGSNFFLIIHMKAYTRNGKKIFFSNSDAEDSLRTYFKFCFDILENLSSVSKNNIELRHYIQKLRK